jgi:hypothetical protein
MVLGGLTRNSGCPWPHDISFLAPPKKQNGYHFTLKILERKMFLNYNSGEKIIVWLLITVLTIILAYGTNFLTIQSTDDSEYLARFLAEIETPSLNPFYLLGALLTRSSGEETVFFLIRLILAALTISLLCRIAPDKKHLFLFFYISTSFPLHTMIQYRTAALFIFCLFVLGSLKRKIRYPNLLASLLGCTIHITSITLVFVSIVAKSLPKINRRILSCAYLSLLILVYSGLTFFKSGFPIPLEAYSFYLQATASGIFSDLPGLGLRSLPMLAAGLFLINRRRVSYTTNQNRLLDFSLAAVITGLLLLVLFSSVPVIGMRFFQFLAFFSIFFLISKSKIIKIFMMIYVGISLTAEFTFAPSLNYEFL